MAVTTTGRSLLSILSSSQSPTHPVARRVLRVTCHLNQASSQRTGERGGVGEVKEQMLDIGVLASRTGVAPSALRYYERLGLLASDGRNRQRRVYRTEALDRVALIVNAQAAGPSPRCPAFSPRTPQRCAGCCGRSAARSTSALPR
ncbi:MerR family DNA-binding transcriptional regulator [Streptomyces sp. NPDC057301]|uniref:MerR family DNA-binding transcriptional regulator n=1 Tax=Streptomyces sp. NPDC057301 TaxID=3346093 RepID=UPI00363A5E8B